MRVINYAPDAFRCLNGFFCIYKPAGLNVVQIRKMIEKNLARDLNCMETRPPRDLVLLEGSAASGHPLSVKVVPNLADHVSVVGPRYQPQDMRIRHACHLGKQISGVLVMAISDSCSKIVHFKNASHLQVIEVKGKFGFATDTLMENGKVIEKATYKHITTHKLERCIASIEASHQAEAYSHAGVRIESQAAYELASKGLVRIHGESPPIIYNVCCTQFSLPDFTLKFHCINMTEEYLTELVHEIGLDMRSCAVCCQMRQVQYDHFTVDHALLQKHWTLEHIISNIILCKKILGPDLWFSSEPHLKRVDPSTVKQAICDLQEEVKSDSLRTVNEMEVDATSETT